MPYNDPDPTDPNVLVGVMLSADAEATTEMAYVFAEEFARMGHDKQQILALFKNPYYGGAHGAYQALGEAAIQAIVDECIDAWGKVKFWILDPSAESILSGVEGLRTGFGLPIGERGGESKIENPKSKMAEGRGEDG
jgi:hypothetical protein